MLKSTGRPKCSVWVNDWMKTTRVSLGLVCACVLKYVCLHQRWQELGKPLGAPPIVPSVDSFVDSVMVRGASVAILTPTGLGRETETHKHTNDIS